MFFDNLIFISNGDNILYKSIVYTNSWSSGCKTYFIASNCLSEKFLIKLIWGVFSPKSILNAFLKRRLSDGSWKLCKFKN